MFLQNRAREGVMADQELTQGDELPEENLVEEVRRRLEARYPRNLLKEHWQERIVDDGANKRGPKPKKKEEKPLDETPYRWWWEFQRAASQFPDVRRNLVLEGEQAASAVVQNDRYFGELGNDFQTWWDKG